MYVVATAGHVDHGKSTLVRALTGMEPDRWAEERRRGMTIDLGYAWTKLPSGKLVAFVDVPGHSRFIGNMLAGLGPAPAVLLVVAADEGWRRQSGEHLAAADALGMTSGLLAVTRSDLADPAAAVEQALAHVANSSLGQVSSVAVSGATGQGLPDLRSALDAVLERLPAPELDVPVRLWIDRAFTVRGAGTIVTGTLAAGVLRTGDALLLGDRTVRVRGLEVLGATTDRVEAVARVAVNLRGVERSEVARGDALLTPGSWRETAGMDVRLSSAQDRLPEQLMLHVGTTAVPVRVRALGNDVVRLLLSRPLPLRSGDRALLRDPAEQRVAAGVLVLDADPPELRRRGAAVARASELASATGTADLATELRRRSAMSTAEAAALGIQVTAVPGTRRVAGWLVDDPAWERWLLALTAAVDRHAETAPLEAGLPTGAAVQLVGLPSPILLPYVVTEAGLESVGGRIRRPGAVPRLGAAEAGLQQVEQRLREHPFAAPETPDLLAFGLGPRELAAAQTAGRILRLHGDVVLLPDGPARAMRLLAGLPQPFTLSLARQALGTTRRVAVPLLEYLDSRGWTRRMDGSTRQVVR